MKAVQAIAKYLSTIRAETGETALLHLQIHICAKLEFIKKYSYLCTFEYITLSAIWIQNLTLLPDKIVLIEARDMYAHFGGGNHR
jgi:hypothetical protein